MRNMSIKHLKIRGVISTVMGATFGLIAANYSIKIVNRPDYSYFSAMNVELAEMVFLLLVALFLFICGIVILEAVHDSSKKLPPYIYSLSDLSIMIVAIIVGIIILGMIILTIQYFCYEKVV